MSIYTRINEDFLDDLAKDAIINEPEAVHDDANDYRFAVVIDGTAANEFVKPVLRVLLRFPDIDKNISVLHSHDSESSRNEAVFDTYVPMKVHWTSKIAICFNASFRTSRSIMLFIRYLHETKKQHRIRLNVLVNEKWEDTQIPWNNSLYSMLFERPWNKNYPYSLMDMIESPDLLKKNVSYTIDIWRYMLDVTPDESFVLCDRYTDIMRLISLISMERNVIMRSTEYLDTDISILNGKKVLTKSLTGRMFRPDPWSFHDIKDGYRVKKAKVTIVNVYPYTCIVLLAYCGDDEGRYEWMYSQHNYDAERPCFVYSKDTIGWGSQDEMSEKKKALLEKYTQMFELSESEAAMLVENIWTTAGLHLDLR